MTIAIYPGSFDPITLGHLDIIERIRPLFSELYVVVAESQKKQYLFTLEERVKLISLSLPGEKSVHIDKCEGLITEFARRKGAQVIVRGLRAIADFEYEMAMANMNQRLYPALETMIVFTRPEYSFVASNIVKEVAQHGGDLSSLVSVHVAQALQSKFKVTGKKA